MAAGFGVRIVLAAALGAVALAGSAGLAQTNDADGPQYDAAGRMIFPAGYREWVFLSSGMDMSYTAAGMPGMHMFGNVFVPRAAYEAFLKTGVWPDKTVLMLENRGASSKGSINRQGQFQTADLMGMEAHVKDTGKPATQIPYQAACYACHEQHAAADTTFVQFYPTLLPTATRLGTLNPAYVKETAGQ
jgi:hypothetical protein